MRLVLLAVMVVSSVATASPKATKSELAARKAWCSRAIDVAKQFDRCAHPQGGVGSMLSMLTELRDGRDTDPELVREFTGKCVEYLQLYLVGAEQQSCKITLPAKQRDELGVFLKAWFGVRTQPVPTGIAALDRQVTAIAKARDELCACPQRDAACVGTKRKRFDDVFMALTDAGAARQVLLAISNEASRCALNVEYGLFSAP